MSLAAVLIRQGPYLKHIHVPWEIKLLHILQEVRTSGKTRSQLHSMLW
jgi:hypothetical protein